MTDAQLDLLDFSWSEARGQSHRIRELDTFPRPPARRSDPETSHLAAEQTAPGNRPLITAIRQFVAERGHSTAFQIAAGVERAWPDRWGADTIRSACARARLVKVDHDGLSPGGRPACRYAIEDA